MDRYGLIKGIAISFILFSIPMALAPLFNAKLSKTLTLMASTFALEYFAASVGAGMGLNPFFVLITILSVGSGVVVLMFGIFEFMGTRSKRISGFLARSHEKAQKSKMMRRYGIYGLIPGAVFLGFYVCPAIAWILGWKKDLSAALIIFGLGAASAIVLLSTLGVLQLAA